MGYNYCSRGVYFVTICTQGKENVFGCIENKKIVLNNFGIVARNEWLRTAQIRTNVDLDTFIIMPNHVHGILVIANKEGYKRKNLRNVGATDDFHWQRNYYDRVIRNDAELFSIRKYILNNPMTIN
jgi:REP element-mobilizing transposase RayT